MRKALYILIIGFISGIAGAFFFEYYLIDKLPTPSESIAITNRVPGGDVPALKQINDASGPPAADQEIRTGYNRPVAFNGDFKRASKNSTPSVVYIKTYSQSSYGGTWLDYFFGERTGQSISSGSGVIYSQNGFIITNNHVVGDADRIEVIIGKKTFEATLIGTDPSTDLAVLKIEGEDLPNIQVSSSQQVEVGEWVLAVGNPFNLTSTVTAGIVSAKGRELNILKSNFPIESFIQTDAAINPGNSGGALVNMDGNLIGINTAILSRTGSYAGYGFAVPSDIVVKVVDDIIDFGEVQKAFIGADVLDIDTDIAQKLGLEDYSGVVVSYVQEDGAAFRAGIRRGDIILEVNNVAIESRAEFEELLSYRSPGDEIQVTYKRNKKIIEKELQLTNKEGTTELIKREVYTSRLLGAELEKVSKVERDLLKIEHGVRIIKVSSGLIRQMGLQEGFIITHINRIEIEDPETLNDILSKIRGRVVVEGVNKIGRPQAFRYYF